MGQGGFSVGGTDKLIEKTEGEKESKGLSDDFMDSGGPCWIAAEIYGGWYELRTILARKYVNSSRFPKLLFNLYMKYGERIANFIRKYKFMKIIFKPIFNIFVERGKKINGK